jgi:hypothetical protein
MSQVREQDCREALLRLPRHWKHYEGTEESDLRVKSDRQMLKDAKYALQNAVKISSENLALKAVREVITNIDTHLKTKGL